jgi:hypothetical protein
VPVEGLSGFNHPAISQTRPAATSQDTFRANVLFEGFVRFAALKKRTKFNHDSQERNRRSIAGF